MEVNQLLVKDNKIFQAAIVEASEMQYRPRELLNALNVFVVNRLPERALEKMKTLQQCADGNLLKSPAITQTEPESEQVISM